MTVNIRPKKNKKNNTKIGVLNNNSKKNRGRKQNSKLRFFYMIGISSKILE